jgi:hypothetical protein
MTCGVARFFRFGAGAHFGLLSGFGNSDFGIQV